MVLITHLIGSASLLAVALGRPRPDSAINEPAVAAPNGIPITLTSSSYTATTTSNDYNSGNQWTATPMPTASYNGYNGYNSGDKKQTDYQKSKSGSYGDQKQKNDYKSGSDKYGSGRSDWNKGYDDCVQQCRAKYNFPSSTTDGSGSMPMATGSGATHTVIVAPTQGVLRYVPFALNASAGDLVKFKWGANNHTVTKGSALLPCNKTADALFTSGTQNKDFEFDLRINDTQPIYFYCATPTHCQKGMFAMINPPSSANSPSSVANMMPYISANYSSVSTYASYAASATQNKDRAANWGSNIDMGSLPDWSHQYVAENVLYTRSFLGINSETLNNDSTIDLGSISTALVFPKDVQDVLVTQDNSTITSTSSGSMSYATSTDDAASSTSPTAAMSSSMTSGSVSLSSSTLLVTVLALASFVLH